MNVITVKLDVTKVDKDRLFVGKNGAKYLDLVLMPNKGDSKYGDTHFVIQSCSKADREAGVKMPIIGNATEKIRAKPDFPPEATQSPSQRNPEPQGIDEDVPF